MVTTLGSSEQGVVGVGASLHTAGALDGTDTQERANAHTHTHCKQVHTLLQYVPISATHQDVSHAQLAPGRMTRSRQKGGVLG